MDANEIILTVVSVFIIVALLIIFDPDLRKKFNKSVKPIDVIQKTADNDLDKKLERLQKLGQLYVS